MSRELKFRAWSLGNRMKGIEPHYVEDFAIDAFYGTPKDIFDGNRSDDGIKCIEQYTGLKDKNGKDIYEGDIVKKYDGGDIAPIIGVVEFYKYGARFAVGGGRNLLSQRWEVIGNIHENPELLEN